MGENKKIVELLRNLIINNYTEETISEVCNQQSLPKVENPLPTIKQSLLSPAGQPLKNATQLNKPLIDNYRNLFGLTEYRKEYKYRFHKDDRITNLIITALKNANKQISYFDNLVEKEQTVDILPPDEFETSVNSFTSPSLIRRMFINDKLVNSMFALAENIITLISSFSNKQGNMDVTATEVCRSLPALAQV